MRAVVLSLCLLPLWGCVRKPASFEPAIGFSHQISAESERLSISLELTEPDGSPIKGAKVTAEGNMSHAGMVPIYFTFEETSPGRYLAKTRLTMAGDWILSVAAKTSDNRSVTRDIPYRLAKP